jgi:hypothetical protein
MLNISLRYDMYSSDEFDLYSQYSSGKDQERGNR